MTSTFDFLSVRSASVHPPTIQKIVSFSAAMRNARGPIASRRGSVPKFLRKPIATCDFPGGVDLLCICWYLLSAFAQGVFVISAGTCAKLVIKSVVFGYSNQL